MQLIVNYICVHILTQTFQHKNDKKNNTTYQYFNTKMTTFFVRTVTLVSAKITHLTQSTIYVFYN